MLTRRHIVHSSSVVRTIFHQNWYDLRFGGCVILFRVSQKTEHRHRFVGACVRAREVKRCSCVTGRCSTTLCLRLAMSVFLLNCLCVLLITLVRLMVLLLFLRPTLIIIMILNIIMFVRLLFVVRIPSIGLLTMLSLLTCTCVFCFVSMFCFLLVCFFVLCSSFLWSCFFMRRQLLVAWFS